MGAFFTNIQFRTTSFDKAEITDKVVEYITNYNEETGFIKVDNEQDADKTIIVSLSNNSEWLSIYDEEMELQGSRNLNKLSSGLSKHFKTIALSIIVNDSDSMYVGISINGLLKDSISNLYKKIDFNKSKPNVWTDILIDNYSFDDIKIAWHNKSEFIEDFLIELAKFIQIDNSKLLTGYNYFSEENPKEGIRLNFAKKEKKKTAELGLTKFKLIHRDGLIDFKRGEKQEINITLTNFGTFSNGLEIIVAGECIEKDLLFPEVGKVSYYNKNEKQNAFNASFLETVTTTGEKIFYARFDDFYIPKGFHPTFPMSPKEYKRYNKIQYDSAINFNISFLGREEGNGNFNIFLSPLINREDGSYVATIVKNSMEDLFNKFTL